MLQSREEANQLAKKNYFEERVVTGEGLEKELAHGCPIHHGHASLLGLRRLDQNFERTSESTIEEVFEGFVSGGKRRKREERREKTVLLNGVESHVKSKSVNPLSQKKKPS